MITKLGKRVICFLFVLGIDSFAMHFCIVSWICILVVNTDGYAGGTCEVRFCKDCVVVEEME